MIFPGIQKLGQNEVFHLLLYVNSFCEIRLCSNFMIRRIDWWAELSLLTLEPSGLLRECTSSDSGLCLSYQVGAFNYKEQPRAANFQPYSSVLILRGIETQS